jgi:hypothetical protein
VAADDVVMCNTPTVSQQQAIARIRADHRSILGVLESSNAWTERYELASGPLGDFCETLHDLAAHVLMWNEINIAVLDEALFGRSHWSLDPRWETPEAGSVLNHAGVASGRHLPGELLTHRLGAAHDSLMAILDSEAWHGRVLESTTVAGLAHRVMTVPGQPAFFHAAVHLKQVESLIRATS